MKTICTHCKAVFKVSDKHRGKVTKCPNCKDSFLIKDYSGSTSELILKEKGKPANPKLKEFFSVKELAEMLSINPMTVYRMVERGQIVCHQIGRAKRFRRCDIENFLKQCVTKKPKK